MKLFADYRQIHVRAPEAKGDLAEAWTAQATDDRIAAAGDIVGIGTEQADNIDVTVEILSREPALQKADPRESLEPVVPGRRCARAPGRAPDGSAAFAAAHSRAR